MTIKLRGGRSSLWDRLLSLSYERYDSAGSFIDWLESRSRIFSLEHEIVPVTQKGGLLHPCVNPAWVG
jgi:hypothetical protein